jgi:hypothetical protein
MKSLAEYLVATDGKTPEQIRTWYSRLPHDEQRELQIAYMHLTENSTSFLSRQSTNLDYYDGRGNCPLICSVLSEYRRVAGNSVPDESLLMSHIRDCTLCQTEWRKRWE